MSDLLSTLHAARSALLAEHPVLRHEPLKAGQLQLRTLHDIENAIQGCIALAHRRREGGHDR
jgi:hypothetical protein